MPSIVKLKKFSVEEIFDTPFTQVLMNQGKKRKLVLFRGYVVNIGNVIFFKKKGVTCRHCGLEGTHYWLEKESKHYRLQLYALKDGQEIPITKDHKLAQAFGGNNNLANLETLCYTCNQHKAKIEGHISWITGMLQRVAEGEELAWAPSRMITKSWWSIYQSK